jgi:head-tail adaptor
MAIQTARLTEELTILEIQTSASTIGAVVETLVPVRTIYGTILNERGNLSFSGPGNVYNNQISFYCRFIGILNKKAYKIRYKEEDYSIEEITHVSRSAATIIRISNSK